MIIDWAGRDTDGDGGRLRGRSCTGRPPVAAAAGTHIGEPSPAERLTEVVRPAAFSDPSSVDLPERLSVFGPTRLSRTHLAVLEALAPTANVHLWLTHPSPAMWDDAAPPEPARAAPPRRQHRADGGRIRCWPACPATSARCSSYLPADRCRHPPPGGHAPPARVLARIQDDIRADRDPAATARLSHDGSVAIHACHGQARQVEVLRESLLHLFNRTTRPCSRATSSCCAPTSTPSRR